MRCKNQHLRLAGRILALALLSAGIANGAIATPPGQSIAEPSGPASVYERQRAATLDELFSKLSAAPNQAEADAIAANIWNAWMHSGRDDVDVLLSRAVANMEGRHFGLARILLDEIIELAPSFAEGWNKRAALYYHMGLYDDALSDLGKTLTLEPRHFGAYAARAAIYADTGRWKEALEAYRAALRINPFLATRDKVLPELERQAGERKF